MPDDLMRLLKELAEQDHALLHLCSSHSLHTALDGSLSRIEALEAENAALRRSCNFAGWFREVPSAMSYRLWEQMGAEFEPGCVALWEGKQ